MAYADQKMSNNRIIALIIVALIHIGIGYALVTGLAYEAVKKAVERVTTVDIEEPPPEEPDEPPPPPEPDTAPPPPVAPPPPIRIAPAPPQIQTQPTIPPRAPIAVRVPPPAPAAPPPAPPPPPPPARPAKGAEPRNSGWITDSDYRSSWVSRDYSGTVSVSLSIDANGRVAGCSVTGGSAPQELKDASCRLIERRARFRAATDSSGNGVSDKYSATIRWDIPQ